MAASSTLWLTKFQLEDHCESLCFKALTTDMRYFARSKFLGSLVLKKTFWVDMTSTFQVRILISSKEVGYRFWVWMNLEKKLQATIIKHVNYRSCQLYGAHPDGVIWKKLTIDEKYINKRVLQTFYTLNYVSKRCWKEKNYSNVNEVYTSAKWVFNYV